MDPKMRLYQGEDDFWKMRNFLREVFLLNNRLERSWNVARLDYWRWHLIANVQVCGAPEGNIPLWEAPDGRLLATLTPVGFGEVRLHTHPHFCTSRLLNAMLAQAEERHFYLDEEGHCWVYTPVESGDKQLEEVLRQRGYTHEPGISHKWQRDLSGRIPDAPVASGYTIRSMGGPEEHPARSWASWRAFHNDEADTAYDGDFSWFANVQAAPLYRRDLDIVAIAPQGEIAAFATIYYDDYTRSAVFVLVGTAAEHWKRGLGKAVLAEGMRRLQQMGCLRAFATAYDPPANALYGSMFETAQLAETWLKQWQAKQSEATTA